MTGVQYLVQYGEWVTAGPFLGLAFLVAVGGVTGLGWWVLRGDRRNRQLENSEDTSDQF